MPEDKFDILVIGPGPGGYVAAIRAAQLGFKTALVDKEQQFGGTCLRVGCIPSKALLSSTEMLHFVNEKGASHGLVHSGVTMDIAALMKRKDDVVKRLCGGIEVLTSKRGITNFRGVASFVESGKVAIQDAKGNTQEVSAKHIIVATGSSVMDLPFLPIDGEKLVTSDHAIAFSEVPEKLVVVGAGAIGLELGSVWARLGSEVTVVELLPQIAPSFDKDMAKLAQRSLQKQGLKFELDTKVTGTEEKDGKLFLTAEKKGKKVSYEATKILVSVGRMANTEGLACEASGLERDERGRVNVNDHFQTNVPNVYAIGDVVRGPMLAHKAEEEGVACVEMIASKAGHVNYDVIPNVIYTEPELASVGIGQDAAKEQGLDVKVGKFAFQANGRAIAADETDGSVKCVADAKTDRLLGMQIIGHNASELIAAAVAHMEYGGSAEDIARTVHAHPTLSEAMKEAALAVDGASLHQL